MLPRIRTASRHPEVFLSTTDNSVVVVNTATTEMKDLDCRARISSPIVEMCFAPNGRFLACFTESSMLTVISTTFETKVLDFDVSTRFELDFETNFYSTRICFHSVAFIFEPIDIRGIVAASTGNAVVRRGQVGALSSEFCFIF